MAKCWKASIYSAQLQLKVLPPYETSLIVEIHERIRQWLNDNPEAIPRLKSGEKWLVGFGWDQNILPGKKYPTAVYTLCPLFTYA